MDALAQLLIVVSLVFTPIGCLERNSLKRGGMQVRTMHEHSTLRAENARGVACFRRTGSVGYGERHADQHGCGFSAGGCAYRQCQVAALCVAGLTSTFRGDLQRIRGSIGGLIWETSHQGLVKARRARSNMVVDELDACFIV